MTMARSDEQLKRGPLGQKSRNFHEKLNLNETALPLQQQTELRCHTAAAHEDVNGKVQCCSEVPVNNVTMEKAQTDAQNGCVNHLLILAQSAEIVAQCEDSVMVGVHTDNQSKGSNNSIVDQVSQDNSINVNADDSLEISQRSGFRYEVARPRLTQIRKQARNQHLMLDQEMNEGSEQKDVHGKTIRLSQIKCQARCKSKSDLSLQKMNVGHNDEQLQGRVIRLNQMKHLARSKGKSTTEEGTEEQMDGHVSYYKFKAANSEGKKESDSVKGRMRLTQLRREARLGNQCYFIMQGPDEK